MRENLIISSFLQKLKPLDNASMGSTIPMISSVTVMDLRRAV